MIEAQFNPYYLTDTSVHSMGLDLRRYIHIKLHHLLEELDSFQRILVVGEYDRASIISTKEKQQKLVNWQRPTATNENQTLVIKCFPGTDYVYHYAALIATHLALNGQDPNKVAYSLPSVELTKETLLQTGLSGVPSSSTVIVGKVEDLLFMTGNQEWQESKEWIWSADSSRSFLLLGCKYSFWGNIARAMSELIIENGCRTLIFVGKLGSLQSQHIPNTLLATGSSSFIDGKVICWENPLDPFIPANGSVTKGVHITLRSVLLETRTWVSENQKFDFVDPEVGNFAVACESYGCLFGYLHVISDNVQIRHHENLSNERETTVIRKRKELYTLMGRILARFVEKI